MYKRLRTHGKQSSKCPCAPYAEPGSSKGQRPHTAFHTPQYGKRHGIRQKQVAELVCAWDCLLSRGHSRHPYVLGILSTDLLDRIRTSGSTDPASGDRADSRLI